MALEKAKVTCDLSMFLSDLSMLFNDLLYRKPLGNLQSPPNFLFDCCRLSLLVQISLLVFLLANSEALLISLRQASFCIGHKSDDGSRFGVSVS